MEYTDVSGLARESIILSNLINFNLAIVFIFVLVALPFQH